MTSSLKKPVRLHGLFKCHSTRHGNAASFAPAARTASEAKKRAARGMSQISIKLPHWEISVVHAALMTAHLLADTDALISRLERRLGTDDPVARLERRLATITGRAAQGLELEARASRLEIETARVRLAGELDACPASLLRALPDLADDGGGAAPAAEPAPAAGGAGAVAERRFRAEGLDAVPAGALSRVARRLAHTPEFFCDEDDAAARCLRRPAPASAEEADADYAAFVQARENVRERSALSLRGKRSLSLLTTRAFCQLPEWERDYLARRAERVLERRNAAVMLEIFLTDTRRAARARGAAGGPRATPRGDDDASA